MQRSLVELEGVEPLLETCSYRFIRESDLTACLAASLPHLPTREQRCASGAVLVMCIRIRNTDPDPDRNF
jgi:hypothetical protein